MCFHPFYLKHIIGFSKNEWESQKVAYRQESGEFERILDIIGTGNLERIAKEVFKIKH